MNDAELWATIVSVGVAIAIRVIDHYWPHLVPRRAKPDNDAGDDE